MPPPANEAHALIEAAMSGEGAYTALRMGKDPGQHEVDRMLSSLMQAYDQTKSRVSLDRDLIMACAVLMHFASECDANLPDTKRADELRDSVAKIRQMAFNILFGIDSGV